MPVRNPIPLYRLCEARHLSDLSYVNAIVKINRQEPIVFSLFGHRCLLKIMYRNDLIINHRPRLRPDRQDCDVYPRGTPKTVNFLIGIKIMRTVLSHMKLPSGPS